MVLLGFVIHTKIKGFLQIIATIYICKIYIANLLSIRMLALKDWFFIKQSGIDCTFETNQNSSHTKCGM
jgi:hypothetical protein